VSPVGGFYSLPVTFQMQTNFPGALAGVYYDFNGDGITDFATNNTAGLTYTYATNGEFFPVATIQTSSGRFSSFGGWNAATLFPDDDLLMVNVQVPPVLVSSISITDPVDLKWVAPTNLYVLSKSTATITQFNTNGTTIRSLSGIGSNPSGLDVDAIGRVYVALTGSNQVWRYYPTNSTFAADASFGTNGFLGLTNGASGTNTGQFNAPFDVAVSPDGGIISVSDSGNNRIQQFDTNGNFIVSFGSGTNALPLSAPAGLVYDSVGTLYVVDSGNNRVLVAVLGTVIGATGTNGNALGQFSGPLNISASTRGIYVADAGNNRVQVFAPDSGLGAAPTPFIPRVGISSELGLSSPAAVAAVPDFVHEYIYVADTGNNRVLFVNLPLDDPSPAWTNMTNHIFSGDVTGALQYFSRLSVAEYQETFLGIGTNSLIPLFAPIPAITPSVIYNTSAEFYFTNVIDGQTITFPIEFTRENGIWKISEF